MSLIQLPGSAGNRQPQDLVGINWDNPDALGLQAWFVPVDGRLIEVSRGLQPSTNTAVSRIGVTGVSADYSGTQATRFGNKPQFGLASPMTIIAFLDVDALTGFGAVVACQNTSYSYGWEFRLGLSSADSCLALTRANAGVKQYKASSSNLITAGQTNVCVAVICANAAITTTPTFIVNDVSYTGIDAGGAGTGDQTAPLSPLWIGQRYDGGTQLDGAINAIGLWNRALSAAAVARIRQNRWALQQPTPRRIWVASAGAATVSTTQVGSWSVRNLTAQTQDSAWTIRNLAATTQTSAWSVRNLAAQTQAGAFSIRNLAAQTQAGAFSIRNLSTTSQSGAWSVINLIAQTQASAWSVRNLAATTQDSAWAIRNLIGQTQAGAWSVSASASTARRYPLEGVTPLFPLSQSSVQYPLAGVERSYP